MARYGVAHCTREEVSGKVALYYDRRARDALLSSYERLKFVFADKSTFSSHSSLAETRSLRTAAAACFEEWGVVWVWE